ncbi:MAG: oligosaccharide flippase family protein [Acidilobaceae archaeon]
MQRESFRLAQLYFKAGTSIALLNYASIAIATFGSVVAARLLGPEGYGLIAVSLFIPSIMVLLAGLSLEGVLSSSIASSDDNSLRRRLFSSALLLVLISSFLLAIAQALASSWLASLLGREELSRYLLVLAPYVVGVSLLSLSQAAFNGLELFHISAFLTLISTATRVLLSLVLILLGYGVFGFLLGQLLSYLLVGVLSVLLVYRTVSGLEPPKLSLLSNLLSRSFPLHISSVISTAINSTKTGFLYRTALDFEIGNLVLASRLTIPLNQVVNAFQTVTLVVSSQSENSQALARFTSIVRYASIPLTFLTGFLLLSVDLIVFLIFGQRFYTTSLYFYFVVAPLFLFPLGYQLADSFLIAKGRTLELSRVSMIVATFSLFLTLGLTYIGGAFGLLTAQMTSSYLTALLQGVIVWKRDFSTIFRENFRLVTPALSGVIIGLAVKLILPGAIGTLLSLLLYLLVFALALPLVVENSDLSGLKEVLEGFGPLGGLASRALSVYIALIEVLWRTQLEEQTRGQER